jgi:hypothetical protein
VHLYAFCKRRRSVCRPSLRHAPCIVDII